MFNLIAAVVMGMFWVKDCRHARSLRIVAENERLGEQMRMLQAAETYFEDSSKFVKFLDAFCTQMSPTDLPGYHLVLFDTSGVVGTLAHERCDPALEEKMAGTETGPRTRFSYKGDDFIALASETSQGHKLVIAQSLAPVARLIRAQAQGRATKYGLLAIAVFALTTTIVLVLVRDPLHQIVTGIHEIGAGRFDIRIPPSANPVLRFVGQRINAMAVALERVEKHRRADMNRARAIQTRLIPGPTGAAGPCKVTSGFYPAEEVGGDLYDIIDLPGDATLFVVLDVSAHGVPAALYSALLRTLLRNQVSRTPNVAAILTAVNQEFADLAGMGDFATCFLVRLDHATGSLEYAGAGHDPAVIVRADGTTELLHSTGLPLGVNAEESYSAASSALHGRERLFLYTDGLHEVGPHQSALLGREKLTELLARTTSYSAQDQIDTVIERIKEIASHGRFEDDATLVCIAAPPTAATSSRKLSR